MCRWLADDAPLVDLSTESDNRIPARRLIERTLSEILAHGNGADRQLKAFAADHDSVEVAAHIADQTNAGASPPARSA